MSIKRSKPLLMSAKLRQRITLQQLAPVEDALGGQERVWQNVATVWAEIKDLSARERLFAGKLEARVTHRIIMRYREDITADMRVLFGMRYFTIRAVINLNEANKQLELMVEEGVAS